jgi:deoxycytidylate deaminase
MKTAKIFAELSHARRLHVGAIVVKDDRIISIGYNGMPAGWDNDCEDIVYDTGAGECISSEEFQIMYPYTEYNEEADE